MEDGDKVVLYTTNKMLFATDSDELQIKIIDTEFAILDDEFHAWSTSSKSNYRENLGHSGGNFLASMYRRLEFLHHSPIIFLNNCNTKY